MPPRRSCFQDLSRKGGKRLSRFNATTAFLLLSRPVRWSAPLRSFNATTAFLLLREATGARLLYIPVARGYGAMEALADRVFPVSELLPEDGEELARRLGLAWR